MSLFSRSAKLAYIIYGTMSFLVIGILGWATVASLRLERTEQLTAQQHEYEKNVRLAMYQMENWANPMLISEFERDPSEYTSLYLPTSKEARWFNGQKLPLGWVVLTSPLLVNYPQHEWVLIYFQASPRGGYRSPQLIPEVAQDWPDFEDAYDTWNREPFASALANLAYAYTTDELLREYEAARQFTRELRGDDVGELAAGDVPGDLEAVHVSGRRSDYLIRRNNAAMMQRGQKPITCAPHQLAVANIHAPSQLDETTLGDGTILEEEEEVDISYQRMLPVWLRLPNRDEPDLAFLRAVDADGERALQGFVIDWPLFRDRLLSFARQQFPDAEVEMLEDQPPPKDETTFSVLPARLVPNAPPPAMADVEWNTTHAFLAFGWITCLVLLGALGLGIRSLVSLSERRSQFAYAVTHELRTPLTTFRLYTDMLAQGMVSEDNRQEYLDTLNQESRRLADLVSGVLEYSRVENDSVPINREPVTIGRILELVRENFGARCEGAGVELEIDEGATAEDVVVTDRQHVVQIIGNLVDNACKYGRNGQQSMVRLSARRATGAYRFEVSDNGPGIPPRLRTTIFKPYRRGDTESTPATGGIGLGLALSRSWARLLGGQLELLPGAADHAGATFRLTLPAESPA